MRALGLFIILLLTRCGAGVSEFTEDLGNGFIYQGFGSELKNIISPFPAQRSIYGKVAQYKYDQNFILALQQPSKEVYRGQIGSELRSKDKIKYKDNSEKDVQESHHIADSVIRYDPYYKQIFARKINYWIISHKNKQTYGPLTEEEYYRKRKELNVPQELQLDISEEND
ncbi:hypothetical protein DYBT9623_05448 [Dyadobacter sp. CECT 9623]|uniref:DUF3997 domain-containing protein n=1 Tax=Dyadobacter linearis TaxID=2823330 RepID=A0ABN7RIL7_9BACT|nr:DUF3997 domain-containing protein [Dyadobacter sp. CECT 9623]CAG5074760.1 hypothetical protein DYBT9623_05448 [Dyadobacter sp. CECT 9623]